MRRRCSAPTGPSRGAPMSCSMPSRSSIAPIRSPRELHSRRRDLVVVLSAVPQRDALRRRAAADRAVHRDVRHIRQLRRARAAVPGRRAAAGRYAAGMESAARARHDARRFPDSRSTARSRSAMPCWAMPAMCRESSRTRRVSTSPRRRNPPAASSVSPTCRSTSPIRSCGARRRCRRLRTRSRRRARLHQTLLDQLGLEAGAQIKIRQGRGEAVLATQVDAGVPPGVVRIAAAHPSTCGLEGLSGPVTVEKA